MLFAPFVRLDRTMDIYILCGQGLFELPSFMYISFMVNLPCEVWAETNLLLTGPVPD